MKMIMATIRPHKLEDVKKALTEAGVQGMSVSEIRGFGRTGGKTEVYRGSAYQLDFVPKVRIDVAVADNQVHAVLEALEQSAKTGKIGDGKVFVLRRGSRAPSHRRTRRGGALKYCDLNRGAFFERALPRTRGSSCRARRLRWPGAPAPACRPGTTGHPWTPAMLAHLPRIRPRRASSSHSRSPPGRAA